MYEKNLHNTVSFQLLAKVEEYGEALSRIRVPSERATI